MIRETALPDQFLHQYTVNFNSLDPVDTCALSSGESVYLPNPTYATSVQRYDRFIRYREDTYVDGESTFSKEAWVVDLPQQGI